LSERVKQLEETILEQKKIMKVARKKTKCLLQRSTPLQLSAMSSKSISPQVKQKAL
jgi:hypothetical protein